MVEVGFAVKDMANHTTDEGWQLFLGLQSAGYELHGHELGLGTDIARVLKERDPGVVVLQDKREWDVEPGNFRDARARFRNVEALASHRARKLTVLKDAQHRPQYHRASADEIGCDAHIVYYDESRVRALAPYVKRCVRTYHTVDAAAVPPFTVEGRKGCLLSGALSDVYPLRQRLARYVGSLPDTQRLVHPGYHRNGCCTPAFLQTLSCFRIAVCTASVYGYLLRKVVEATACGCVVVTNLQEAVPEVDGNMVRVPDDISISAAADVLRIAVNSYDPAKQEHYAKLAIARFDYRVEGARLAEEIRKL